MEVPALLKAVTDIFPLSEVTKLKSYNRNSVLPMTFIVLFMTAVLNAGPSPITSHLYLPDVSSEILVSTTDSSVDSST